MSVSGVNVDPVRLSQHSGWIFLAAPEALLKGVLESEVPVELIAGPREGAMRGLFVAAEDPATAALLRQHGTALAAAPDAGRAVTLALQAARSLRRAIAVIPNGQLDRAMPVIERACATPLEGRAAMCLILEDSVSECPTACPRRAAIRLGLACLEPATVGELSDAVDLALRLSRAGGSPIAMVVQSSVLRTADTIEAHPNRVIQSVDALIARRRRRPRPAESGGLLRLARRLEVNRFSSVPSPGERVPVGFVAVGPAATALEHVVHAVGLVGRVPIVRLSLVHPLDEPLIERILSRCEQVVILEPRPGSVESEVQSTAEAMRRRAERPATIWGSVLPPSDDGQFQALGPEDACHPSILARRVIHLLHAIRPTLRVASRLTPDPPALRVQPLPRGAALGAGAAGAAVRRMLVDVDQWLRDRQPAPEDPVGPSALALDGVLPDAPGRRLVMVEIWDERQFAIDGIAALRQAARDERPWMLVICDLSAEGRQDLERLVGGAIPGDRADRVHVASGDLADPAGLRDLMRQAALHDGCTVLLARDGPPPRFSLPAIEQSLADVDRLGFQTVQRVTWPADEGCAVRQPPAELTAVTDQTLEPETAAVAHFEAARLEPEPSAAGLRMRVRPMLEQVEVVRIRPPAARWRLAAPAKLPLPAPVHAQQAVWRAHLAGCRAMGLGLGAIALAEAGRLMGYHVRATCDPVRIGPGQSAWSQVLFTRPRTDEPPAPLCVTVPYGEADLLIGLGAEETLRAIDASWKLRVASPDRTYAVVNLAAFSGEGDSEHSRACREELVSAIRLVARPSPMLLDDLAVACRSEFHTDRVTDVALLGAAFQLGLVPVSLEAIEGAAAGLESRGFGRSVEAFAFGRHLVARPEMFERPRDEREDDAGRAVRRSVRSVARSGWGGISLAARFRSLVEHHLGQLPGLAETEVGRVARRDFVVALRRCLAWGGFDYADLYAQLIGRVYQADRGDRGRALARCAILPLAEAMLPRDLVYVAAIATSLEHRRRTRLRLNVKSARGDRLERRYLTRIDVEGLGWRLRWDVRTSDWPARLLSTVRRWVPRGTRGTVLERQIRDYVLAFVQRAAAEATNDYDRWQESMKRLHERAAAGGLHDTALSELRMLIEPDELMATPDAAPAPAGHAPTRDG